MKWRQVLLGVVVVGLIAQMVPFLAQTARQGRGAEPVVSAPPPSGAALEAAASRAEAYNRPFFPAYWAGRITYVAGMLLIIVSGLSLRVEQRFGTGRYRWPMRCAFFLGLFLWISLLCLPRQLAGYFHARSFGLTNLDFSTWFWLNGIAILLPALFFMLKYLLLFCGMLARRKHWWLTAVILVFVCFILIPDCIPQYPVEPVWRLTPLPPGPHAQAMQVVSLAAGEKMRFMVVDHSRRSNTANMYLYGTTPDISVVLTDTFLAKFSPSEAATVVAHEMGHLRNRWLFIAISDAIGLLILVIAFMMTYRITGRHHMPPVHALRTLTVAVLFTSIASIALLPVSSAVGRNDERMADRYALDLTRDADSFRSALSKLADINLERMDIPSVEYYLLSEYPSMRERLLSCSNFTARAVQ